MASYAVKMELSRDRKELLSEKRRICEHNSETALQNVLILVGMIIFSKSILTSTTKMV